MMKKGLLILLCLPIIGFGQGWEKTFDKTGGDEGYSVQQTTDGGFIICGTIGVTVGGMGFSADVYLIKTDSQGDTIWTKTFGNIDVSTFAENQYGNSVQQTADGGYIICGKYYGPETYYGAVYLIKTDGNGIEQWSQTIGGDFVGPSGDAEGFSVIQTIDGGYVITGRIFSNLPGSSGDIYLIKTDFQGDTIWTKSFGGVDDDCGYSVQQTTDGGYIVAGSVYSEITSLTKDIYLIKTDTQGDTTWTKKIGDPGRTDEGYSVQQTADGGYIICGSMMNSSFTSEMCLIKTNNLGNMMWTETFSGYGEGRSVQQTIDGGYIIAGTLGTKLHLVKTNNMGSEQWKKTFLGPTASQSWGYSVRQTTDGGYIISGKQYSPVGIVGWDIYLIKTDDNGNATSIFNIPINPNRKLQKTVDILGKETKPQTNIPFIKIYDDGTVEKRIVIE